jgi:hypothetical protein
MPTHITLLWGVKPLFQSMLLGFLGKVVMSKATEI